MATIDIGKLTFTHKGDYAGGTAYVLNDVVYYNGSAYIAKTSTTGNLPTSTAHWNLFSAGSGGIWNSGLSLGSAGEVVKVNSGASALEFGTISSGTYSIHKVDNYSYTTAVSGSGSTNYLDISGGNTVSFQPTSTSDKIFFCHTVPINLTADTGCSTYIMMKAGSSSIGSGDTKLDYNGTHAFYENKNANFHAILTQSFVLPCTGLSTSTTYYCEVAGAIYDSNTVAFGMQSSNHTGSYKGTNVSMIHYKFNS